MTNRQKYFTQRNEYDLLMDLNISILSNDYRCVKECLTDEYQYQGHHRCCLEHENCSECLQNWLNEEAKEG